MPRKKTLMDEWEIFYRGNILRAEVFSYMAFRVNEVVCVACLSHSWHVTVKLSHANDFLITKSHAREKPLLAVYRDKKIIMNLKKLKFPSEI